MRGVIGVLVCALLACGGSAEHQPEPATPEQAEVDYAAKREDMYDRFENQIIWPICEVPPKGEICGMLADKYLTKRFLERFIEEKCAGENDVKCLEKFRIVYLSLVRNRYPLARQKDIDARCLSVPAECEYLASLELLYLKSHNGALAAQMKSRLAELDGEQAEARRAAHASQQAQRERAARKQRLANALAAFGAGLQSNSGPVVVTSTCNSDYQCPPGSVCAKDSNAMTGACARAVNQYGTPAYTPPRGDSYGPGTGNCSFDTDCSPGFRCVKTSGGLRGNCMK
jgi:hypothetical protein